MLIRLNCPDIVRIYPETKQDLKVIHWFRPAQINDAELVRLSPADHGGLKRDPFG
jgi:hypothetical protein